jgi:ribose transport system substrate-binding protein
MIKKFGNKYNYNSRKKHYKAKHGSSSGAGSAGTLINSLMSMFLANKLKYVTMFVAVVAVLVAVLTPAFAKPLPASSSDPQVVADESTQTGDESGDTELATSGPVDSFSEDYDEVNTLGVDEETLKGLTGEGLTDEDTGDVSDAELKGSIGVIFDNVNSTKDTIGLQKIEEAAKSAIDAGSIGVVKYYNSKGDLNQQLQDMRSMVNSNVKAIVIVVSDKETYLMMTQMAKDANIPVVAINAPVSQGYMVNIKEDTSGYGQLSADFIREKLLNGSYLEINAPSLEAEEQQRIKLIDSALKSNANLKSAAAAITVENKTAKIKTALETIFKDKTLVDAISVSQGMAKSILNAFLAQQIMPKVFIGDSTAGYIKLWYTLKTKGVTLEKMDEDTSKSSKKSSKTSQAPKETFVMKLTGSEAFCAESTPYGAGGAAFKFALRLGMGKKLKEGALANNTYTYSPKVLITDANLEEYYTMAKNQADSYILSDFAQDTDIDALFDQ